MSVVQRCPNCGTTKATAGECEACHEAQVRYFCTNHTPGIWLDARTCPSCGARFGESVRRVPAPAAVVPTPTRTPAPAPAPARTPAATAVAGEEELETISPRMAMWQKILSAAVRMRERPMSAELDRPPIRRALGGCLVRSLLLVVLLFVVLAGAVFVFGQALFNGF